jgi:hypothetical protein
VLFGSAFALSYTHPLLIEQAAREVVRIEVEKRVGERIDSLSDSRIGDFAQRALARVDADIARAQQALRDEVPRRVAEVVASMLEPDCVCRQRLVERMQQAENERLASLTQVRERLTGLIESAYGSVTRSLMREFRIFTATNAAAFALLALVTLVRRRAGVQLVLPAAVLVGAVLLTGSVYLFNQDWMHTILFGQYVGLGYSAWLAGVALLLADIAFNRARVTTEIVNAAFNVVGAAASAVPC